MCSLGIEPTTFCAADAMLYHWATEEHNSFSLLMLTDYQIVWQLCFFGQHSNMKKVPSNSQSPINIKNLSVWNIIYYIRRYPPYYVKHFECLEKHYINVTHYYYYIMLCHVLTIRFVQNLLALTENLQHLETQLSDIWMTSQVKAQVRIQKSNGLSLRR